jgi:hypothetical protein
VLSHQKNAARLLEKLDTNIGGLIFGPDFLFVRRSLAILQSNISVPKEAFDGKLQNAMGKCGIIIRGAIGLCGGPPSRI